jgi:lysyl-tRNA synthetase class 2
MNHQESSDLFGQRKQRIQKLKKIRDLGIDPYPPKAYRTHTTKDVKDSFNDLEGKTVCVVGRLWNKRSHGKIVFYDLKDFFGEIQLYIKHNELEPTNSENQNIGFDHLDLIDIGDIVEAYGIVTKTKSGEISVLVKQLRILTKAIRPLPTNLEDKEERFRRRYLDMQLHPEIRQRFIRRSLFWEAIREFLNSEGFIEINIPVLEHVTGGADAKPFVTHYDALNQDFYLRISHELPLKRLLGAGYEKVYDIGPRFRNEGFSDEHLPEHVAMEFYWAYADAKDGMELTKKMYRYVLKKVYGTTKFKIKEFDVDLEDEWREIDFVEVIKKTFDVDVFNDSVDKMIQILKDNDVDLGENVNRNRVVDNLWKLIRKTIGGPAFLINVPKFLSPLAKSDPKNPKLTQRFHPIIAGSELANAFGELNDPIDQLERFLEQQKLRESGDDEAHMLDIDFVEMLEYGMPPAVGFGLSERVFWFFENVSAKEGVPFPQLKYYIDDTTRKIYPNINFETAKEVKTKKENSQDINGLPSRQEAFNFLNEKVSDDYQKLHALMVANVLEAWAEKLGENKDLWFITGLLHDIDYFQHPNEHPDVAVKWFEERKYPKELIHAVKAHYVAKRVEPKSLLDAALIASDELSGLMYAYSLMRPEKFKNMKPSKVLKQMKNKAFAAKINRDDIKFGVQKMAEMLNKTFDDMLNLHIEVLLDTFNKMENFKS